MPTDIEIVSTRFQNYADRVSSFICIDKTTLQTFNSLIDEIASFIKDKKVDEIEKQYLLSDLNNRAIEVRQSIQCDNFSYLKYDTARRLIIFIGQINKPFELAAQSI
jgi:hypothetical protein